MLTALAPTVWWRITDGEDGCEGLRDANGQSHGHDKVGRQRTLLYIAIPRRQALRHGKIFHRMSMRINLRHLNRVWLARLSALGVYFAAMALGNLLWEFLQLPLYRIGQAGTAREQVFAALHCTVGDILIGLSSFLVALVLVRANGWPACRFWPVAAVATACGLAYTIYSEWLNVVVRASWAYAASMPIVPLFGFNVGLSPLLQWAILPIAAFAIARTHARRRKASY
jgi:hypothetical protein